MKLIKYSIHFIIILLLVFAVYTMPAFAQDNADELAKQLANPVADLACLPF